MANVLNKANVVVQVDSDGSYSNSGYLVCVKDGVAAIGHISHCSCYGTFNYNNGEPDGLTEVWSGPVADLRAMAERNADPEMPTRAISDDDCDAKYLKECYKEFLSGKF